jgi:hypothetical protein
MDIGKRTTTLSGNKFLIKGRHGRYVVEVFENHVDFLGIGNHSNGKNMKNFQNLMNQMYDLDIKEYSN